MCKYMYVFPLVDVIRFLFSGLHGTENLTMMFWSNNLWFMIKWCFGENCFLRDFHYPVIILLCFSNSSEGSDQIPPPPVAWNQVSGLQPFIETGLKKILQEISQTETWQTLQPLTTTYMIYLGVYYRACSQQVRPEIYRVSFHLTGISLYITTKSLKKERKALKNIKWGLDYVYHTSYLEWVALRVKWICWSFRLTMQNITVVISSFGLGVSIKVCGHTPTV